MMIAFQDSLLRKLELNRSLAKNKERYTCSFLTETIIGMGQNIYEFDCPTCEMIPGSAHIEVLPGNSLAMSIPARSYPQLKDAPTGIIGSFKYIENISDLSSIDTRNSIVLINEKLTNRILNALVEAGALAVITHGGRIIRSKEVYNVSAGNMTTYNAISNAMITAVDIDSVNAMCLLQNDKSTVSVFSQNDIKTGNGRNISVILPGTKRDTTDIVLCSHYDSVSFSPGIFDNLSGCLVNLKLLSHYVQNRPESSIMFCWFTAEEQGAQGSHAFVQNHLKELAKVKLVVNIDSVACSIGCDTLYYCMNDKRTCKNLQESDVMLKANRSRYYGDNLPFEDIGLETVTFTREGVLASSLMHQEWDTFFNAGITDDSLSSTAKKIMTLISPFIRGKV